MDGHTANWGVAILDFYQMTKNPMYLELARAAGNTLTQNQLDNGFTITWMGDQYTGISPAPTAGYSIFQVGSALSATLWLRLAELESVQPSQSEKK
jgi:hypothetical protein